jgi:hypothetical protein
MSSSVDEIITDWDVYPTYQGYLDMMNQFATTYPNLCTIVNIGTTVQGRQLLFAKLSANVNNEENEPEAMYASSMHGDETTGYVLMLRLINYLLSNYGTDPEATNILNNMEVWICPLSNPDGSYHSGNNSVNGSTRYNANGVDLNRNFPDPADGNHPDGNAWQPETIAMMNFISAHSFTISANFHGGAEVVNYPWDTWSRLHADDSWFINISRAYADTVHAHAVSGYMTDLDNGITNGYAWYRVAGGRQDYCNYWKGDREETIELSHTKLLPAGQLPAHWNYNYRSFLNFIENTLYGIRGLVTDASTSAPLAATITVLGHDIDSSRVFTDPNVGDYHRMIAPGTYSLQFSSPGYISQTVNNVVVINRQITNLNVQLQAVPNSPMLSFLGHDSGAIGIPDTAMFHITLVNGGGALAQNVVGTLSTTDSYISIFQNSSNYPNIQPLGGTGTSLSNYSFAVSPSCPPYHEINIRLGFTAAGGYIDSAFFSILVGEQIENFETGNFSSYPWQMAGNAAWTITSSGQFEGNYCARSGAITDNQHSDISVSAEISADGMLRFHFRVSSEASYDYLKFYVDNNLQSQWAGETEWAEAAFDVTAGMHTFKWEYNKDQSLSRGSDCAWIDYIVFPPLAQTLQITTASLPDWTIGRPYSQQLEATGGMGNRTWTDFSGGLIGTGLALSGGGLLSGTPSSSRQINLTIQVQDQIGGWAQRPFTFTINPALVIVTTTIPDGQVSTPYSAQLQASGGTGAKTWIDRDNDLSGTGITLSTDGLLSGVPLIPDTIAFTAHVSDITGDSEERDLNLAIIGRGPAYIPGDANGNGETNGIDVLFMINFFKGGQIPPFVLNCPPHGTIYAACDVNGSCVVNGIDATYLVNYLKGSSAPEFCQDCPPGGLGLSATTIESRKSK